MTPSVDQIRTMVSEVFDGSHRKVREGVGRGPSPVPPAPGPPAASEAEAAAALARLSPAEIISFGATAWGLHAARNPGSGTFWDSMAPGK